MSYQSVLFYMYINLILHKNLEMQIFDQRNKLCLQVPSIVIAFRPLHDMKNFEFLANSRLRFCFVYYGNFEALFCFYGNLVHISVKFNAHDSLHGAQAVQYSSSWDIHD